MGGDDTMEPTKTDTRLTYDDFLLFPDDGQRHELIDGEHDVTPSPNPGHQRLSVRLTTARVVDPELDLVKVHRRAPDGGLPRVAELTAEAGDVLTTPMLPGFELALSILFR